MVWWFRPRVLPLVGAGIPSPIAPVVIGGCGSSGTTLLRKMLDRHPEVSCGDESTVFLKRMSSAGDIAQRYGFEPAQVEAWRRESCTRAEFIERFQAACLARSGKRVWAEKTPENIRAFPWAARQFPQARLVHVIRDGRDVACSLRQAAWMPLEKMTGGAARSSPEALDACVRYWAERARFGRALRDRPGYFEIRYEDLVYDPRAAMGGLLRFLGLDWDERVLQASASSTAREEGPVTAASIGRWRREFGAREAAVVEDRVGPLLRELGYAASPGWGAQLPRIAPPPPAARAGAGKPGRARKRLRRELVALGLAAMDGQAPLAVRCLPLFAAAYMAIPDDLIPDRLGLVGWSDDLAVVVLSLAGLAGFAPAASKARHRSEAAMLVNRRVWALPRLGRRAPVETLQRGWSRLLSRIAGQSYVMDKELRIVSASPATLQLWGKPPREVLGRPLTEVFPAVVAGEGYAAVLRAVRTSRPVSVRTISVIFGGRMNLQVRPLSDGVQVRFKLAA